MDDPSDGAITLPDTIKAPSAAMIAALNNVVLHDLDSAGDLLTELDLDSWVTEEQALAHLNDSLKDLERGSKETLADWQRGSGKYLRTINTTLESIRAGEDYTNYSVHADKLLEPEIFNVTRGMPSMTLRLDEETLVELSGSNDSTVSDTTAGLYLECLTEQGVDAEFIKQDDTGLGYATCNGNPQTGYGDQFSLSSLFTYALISPSSFSVEDVEVLWDVAKRYGALYQCMAEKNCSEASLTGFTISEYDDSDEQDGSDIQEDKLSSSYDAVTGVYTEVKNRLVKSGEYAGRESVSLSFAYLVDGPESDRYVDFIGTWEAVGTKPGCDVAVKSTYVFNEQGVTVNGEEFSGDCVVSKISAESVPYSQLSDMDYWWFTTNGAGNDSKATLSQLNTTIRWCDADVIDVEVGCAQQDQKINRWEYAPAGADWDRGILNRRTLDPMTGNVLSTISMHKVN